MKVLIILTVCAVGVYGKVAPDYFPHCKRSDPAIASCFRNGIEDMRSHLKRGIPSIRVPAIEPLTIPTLEVDWDSSGPDVSAVLYHIQMYGGGDFEIQDLKVDLNGVYRGEVKITVPAVRGRMHYDVRKLGISFLSFADEGRVSGTCKGVTAVIKGSGSTFRRNGETYLKTDDLHLSLDIDDAEVDIEHSENYYKAKFGAWAFNTDPHAVLKMLRPMLEHYGAQVLKQYFDEMLSSVPLNEILLDD